MREYHRGQTVHFKWATNGLGGEAASRSTPGTVSVYKDNDTTQVTTGVTDTANFDSTTGLHHCAIALTDAFYAKGSSFQAVLTGAVVDGVSIAPTVLFQFHISHATVVTVVDDAANAAGSFEVDLGDADDAPLGAWLSFISGALAGQTRRITDFVDSTNFVTVDPAFTAEPAAGDLALLINGL